MKTFFTLFLFCFSQIIFALDVPDLRGRRVIDNGDMITPGTEDAVTALLQAHEDATGNQVAVLIVASLEGENLEAYANRVFNTWRLGQKEKNNGVLLLIAREERRIRIEVGYGLEPELTDLEASQIIDHEITPRFRKGEYDAGVTEGVKAILEAIGGVYVLHTSTSGSEPDMGYLSSGEAVVIAIFVILLISLFMMMMAHIRSWLSYLFIIAFHVAWWELVVPFYHGAAIGAAVWLLALYVGTRIYVWKKKKWFSWEPSAYGYKNYTWGPGWGGRGGSGGGGGYGGGGGGFSGGGGSSGGGGASGGW